MAANTPPGWKSSFSAFVRLRQSQTRTLNLRDKVIGSGTIVFFAGDPNLSWVTIKGNGVMEIDPPNNIDVGRYRIQVQAISVFGVATDTITILVQRALRPRWDWGSSVTEYISENLLDNWNLENEVEGDGTITISKVSGPSWAQINGFILTMLPPEIVSGEYQDFNLKLRATSEWGTRDTVITLRVQNDGQTSLYFDLPDSRVEIAEGSQFSFDASDFVQNNVGAVTYIAERHLYTEWLTVNETSGLVTGTAPLVDADEKQSLRIEVRDSQSFRRSVLFITVKNAVEVPDPTETIQWGTIPNQDVEELKSFSFSIRSFLTGTTSATFSKQSGPAWVSISSTGSVTNTASQTPPDVSDDTEVSVGVRATVDSTNYDTTFTINVQNVVGGDPASNNPPVIAGNIPDVYVDELTYFEFSVGSHVTGGTSGGAIVISKETGPPWLSIGNTGACTGTPKSVPSDTTYPVTFSATSVFGTATNGAFNLIVRNVRIATEAPLWGTLPVFYANEFSRFNRNIRRYVSGSGLITIEKIGGPSWISISSNGQSLTGVTPRTSQRIQEAVVVRARSAYGTAIATILFVVRDSLNPETRLTFKPVDITLNEGTNTTRNLSSYITGATGTVSYQVNHDPNDLVSISGSTLTCTAPTNVDNTERHPVFLRATDSLGGVTAVITVTVRNTTGGGIPITQPTQRTLPVATGVVNTAELTASVDEIVYNVYTFSSNAIVRNQGPSGSSDGPSGQQDDSTTTEGTWTKLNDDHIVDYGTISRALDDVRVNEYKVSQATVKLNNVDDMYSPKNPDNYFNELYGDPEAYGMPIYIEAGYHTAGGTRVERVFEGIVINVNHDVGGLTVTLQLSDDAQFLRREFVQNFGLTKRMVVELEYNPETEQGEHALFDGLTPISDNSPRAVYPPDLQIEEVFNKSGNLSPKHIQINEGHVLSEILNPNEVTRYQLEFKSPHRHRRFCTAIQDIASAAQIPVDRQRITLPSIYTQQEIFSNVGRPDYEIVHNFEQIQSRALIPFRWNGFVTDVHYDTRDEHDKFYFLVSCPIHEPEVVEIDEPSDKEVEDDFLNVDQNFGGVLDNYQKSVNVQEIFGANTQFRPKLIQYDRTLDQWSELASRLQEAEWWKMTPNADYTTWFVLGTDGVNTATFLDPKFGAQATLTGQSPTPSTYDAYVDGDYSVFIEEINPSNGNVITFVDGDSDYPPQLAHFYYVGYGYNYVGPNNDIKINNQHLDRFNYFRDGIKPDSRRPIIWHDERLYYGFVRNTNANQDFGVVSTANGTSFTEAFNPVNVDSNNNHMGFTFDIKGDKLDFAFTILDRDGTNTTFKVIQVSV